MSYELNLTEAPRPQLRNSLTLSQSDVVIGRDLDCHWVIDDPDEYVSGQHCVITHTNGRYVITDCSTNGLTVNGAPSPLGRGNSADLVPGMTLQLGDYVIEVGSGAAEARPDPAPRHGAAQTAPPSSAIDLGLRPPPPASTPTNTLPKADRSAPAAPAASSATTTPPAPTGSVNVSALFPGLDPAPQAPKQAPPAADPRPGRHEIEPPRLPKERPHPAHPSASEPPRAPAHPEPVPKPRAVDPEDLRAAFFEGLRLDPAAFATTDPAAQMEALGARFRALADGVVYLLRARERQKGQMPVRRTQIGVDSNNPLKTLPGTDRPLRALIEGEGEGFLLPDTAIEEAIRDLALHNISTLNGIEAALRKLVADINPEQFERELAETGTFEVLAAGGRSAMLWKLYKDKYADLSQAAEERFLGTVGSEFARIYEQDRGS